MENRDNNREYDFEKTVGKGNTPPSADNEKVNKEAVTVDAFLSSLKDIKSNDIAPPTKTKKRIKFPYVLRVVLLTVFLSVFVISAVMIVSELREGHWADKMYSDLSDDFFSGTDRTGYMSYLSPAVLDTTTPKFGSVRNSTGGGDYTILDTNNQFFAQFKEKLTEYKQKNPDIYGWIQVDGTNISYACVKGADNDYYLNHTATLDYNANGAIFADFRCADDIIDNPNLVFYGHNSIYPGQMFHEITNFLDESFFRNNRYVTIYTLDGVYRYEIFAIYETHSTYRYCQISFVSGNSFVNWCNEMKANSMYQIETDDFTPDSKILTLSTCTNGYFTRRYSLQARLVSVEK